MNPTGHIYMSNINMKMHARHPGTDYQLERGTIHKAVVRRGAEHQKYRRKKQDLIPSPYRAD